MYHYYENLFITCEKSSWMAPNKYVKEISFCR
ncbi:DUF1240 domain-containing protein [Xenorhabdus beddingii]|nr:DUF1240 domain-containing protein [Xenorhabdus beddingii]